MTLATFLAYSAMIWLGLNIAFVVFMSIRWRQ